MVDNHVVVTEGWLEQLVGLASIRVTTETNGETNARISTTEGTQNTELGEAKDGQFRGVRDAYPGRNITVIDLAPAEHRGNGEDGV